MHPHQKVHFTKSALQKVHYKWTLAIMKFLLFQTKQGVFY